MRTKITVAIGATLLAGAAGLLTGCSGGQQGAGQAGIGSVELASTAPSGPSTATSPTDPAAPTHTGSHGGGTGHPASSAPASPSMSANPADAYPVIDAFAVACLHLPTGLWQMRASYTVQNATEAWLSGTTNSAVSWTSVEIGTGVVTIPNKGCFASTGTVNISISATNSSGVIVVKTAAYTGTAPDPAPTLSLPPKLNK